MKGFSASGKPDVSFIVPSYESRRTIAFTLQSILALESRLGLEVIVVDSSHPPVTKWLRTRFPSVKVVHSTTRLYPGAARNQGAGEARGRYLAFVDADAVLMGNWLDTLVRHLEDDPTIFVTGGAVSNANPTSIASRVQHWIEFSTFLPNSRAGLRPFLSSSNFLMRREDFLDSPGFSTAYAMAEDMEYFRSLPDGILFDANTGVAHHHRVRWGPMAGHLRSLGFWSGRLRASAAFPGDWLRHLPLLSFLLPVYRYGCIVLRVGRAHRGEGLRALIHSPWIMFALFSWARGFYRGLAGTLGGGKSNTGLK